MFQALWPAALAIALMSFTETIASGRAFAGPDQERPSPNGELVATGLGNVLGGFIGAMPSGGGTSQTLVNQRAGARSQLAGLVTGLAALATLLVLAPTLSHLPQAVLAAIVVVYSADLLGVRDFKAIYSVRRTEFVWAVTAFAGVLVLGTLRGILVAVITSLVALAYQASAPAVYESRSPSQGTSVFRRLAPPRHPEDETFPGLLLIRVEGRVFFGNAERVLDLMTSLILAVRPKVIVLDGSAIFDIEYTALKMLAEAEERVRRAGSELWLAALNPETRGVVERSLSARGWDRRQMCFDLAHAVAQYEESPPA